MSHTFEIFMKSSNVKKGFIRILKIDTLSSLVLKCRHLINKSAVNSIPTLNSITSVSDVYSFGLSLRLKR